MAIYEREGSNRSLSLKSLTFFELFDFFKSEQLNIKYVIIEGGWLVAKSNFRATNRNGVNARIGKNVGSNHESGRKIVEMCEYLNIPYHVVKPLKKTWGKDRKSKITQSEFKNLTKYPGRTNQEERDAALLVWGY